jgi:predicted amino acid-binding ACT domain protein
VTDARWEPTVARAQLLVHGTDQLGNLSAVMAVVAGHGGNVADLTTRLTSAVYVVVTDIDLRDLADLLALDADLHIVANELGVDAVIRRAPTRRPPAVRRCVRRGLRRSARLAGRNANWERRTAPRSSRGQLTQAAPRRRVPAGPASEVGGSRRAARS